MRYKIRIEGHDFNVDVGDLNQQPVQVIVDGDIIEVFSETVLSSREQVKLVPSTTEERREPISTKPQPPPVVVHEPDNTYAPDRAKALRAPIPGIIIKIAVKVGTEVEYGQELCILEAMKMNNFIRAPQTGTIAAIHINVGDHVKHGDVLMEFA